MSHRILKPYKSMKAALISSFTVVLLLSVLFVGSTGIATADPLTRIDLDEMIENENIYIVYANGMLVDVDTGQMPGSHGLPKMITEDQILEIEDD